MLELLIKLLGGRLEQAARVIRVAITPRGGTSFGWIFLIAVLLMGIAIYTYRRHAEISPQRRYGLLALRGLFLLLLLAMLLRPILTLTVEGSARRTLVYLVDTSLSMNLADPRLDDADLKRAAIGKNLISPNAGLNQSLDKSAAQQVKSIARMDLVKATLENPKLNLVSRLADDYDTEVYTFDSATAGPIARQTRIAADSNTLLSTILLLAALVCLLLALVCIINLARLKFRHALSAALAFGLFLFALTSFFFSNWLGHRQIQTATLSSIGNGGTAWVDGLQAKGNSTALGKAIDDVLAKKRGQPLAGIFLITDGANNAGPAPADAAADAQSEGVPIFAYGVGITSPRDIVVSGIDTQPVAFVKDELPVVVRVRSQSLTGEKATLELKLNNHTVASKEIAFGANGEFTVPLKFTPDTQGDFKLEAYIAPRDDEASKTNNSITQPLRVIDGKIKVLIIERAPRWEFKYLQAMLARDRRVDLKCLLTEGDASIADGENSPYLAKFPAARDELFKYDVVILGDVDPAYFSADQQQMLSEFVYKFGGAMVSIAGRRFNPSAYGNTVLEKMLPVDVDAAAASAVSSDAAQPIHLELTPLGKASPMLRLSDREKENLDRWNALPPLYWESPVLRPKPAAQVLMVDSDPSLASRIGKLPVIALQQYGLGQVLYVGTDDTWRWRKNAGEQFHLAIWSQIIQRMALPHLLGISKQTQLAADKENYVAGEKVTVYARLYDQNYQPITDPTVKGYFGAGAEGITGGGQVTLRMEDQPGRYRGEFIVPAPGHYTFKLERDAKTSLAIEVGEPLAEMGDTSLDETSLKYIAQVSGGGFFREENIQNLPDAIHQKSQQVQTRLELELWSSPLYFLLLLGVVSAEWICRKLVQLK